jgi:uncharacterized protein
MFGTWDEVDNEFGRCQLGTLWRIPQKNDTLRVFLSPAAEAGNAEAQFILACMFERGEGVKKNVYKAFEWYQKGTLSRILQNISALNVLLSPAAEAGLAEAQFSLAYMFERGKGVKKNVYNAFKWYNKGILSRIFQNINTLRAIFFLLAAESGLTDAQINLARMFEIGKGVEANLVEAFGWYKKGTL